jgi:hypothetical protein
MPQKPMFFVVTIVRTSKLAVFCVVLKHGLLPVIHNLQVFENKVLGEIFRSKRDELSWELKNIT